MRNQTAIFRGQWGRVRDQWGRVHFELVGIQSARERGTATAEYAIATLAACGFAGLLLVILRSSQVRELLVGIIQRALSVG